MNQSNESILWSMGVIVLSFCICFTSLYFTKIDCVTTHVNNKGKTRVDTGKVASISSIISISLGICVFVFLLKKDNNNTLGSDLPKIAKVFVPKRSDFNLNDTWVDPI